MGHLPFRSSLPSFNTTGYARLFRKCTDLESKFRLWNKVVRRVWKWVRTSVFSLSKSTQIYTR